MLSMYAFYAGLFLGSLELLLVLATGRDLFLTRLECLRYALLALSATPLLTLALGAASRLALRCLGAPGAAGAALAFERRLRWAVFVLGAPAAGWFAWLLTAGRRVRDLPAREALCVGLAIAAGISLGAAAVRLWRIPAGTRAATLAGAALLWIAALALGIDALVLKRLYPAFHVALGVLALCAALLGCAQLSGVQTRARTLPAARRGMPLLLVALVSLYFLAGTANARFAIVQSAPLSGRLLRLLPAPKLPLPSAEPWGAQVAGASRAHSAFDPGALDLRGRDVLLITVDALRADQLRAYGGSGNTPVIDALAREAAVFVRAYTPTPHTSYALSSLLTGKFIKPLHALTEGGGDHPTLPEMLRSFGYRTAAFYPPAIFFVDGERFGALSRKQFGFEYVKVMYASAAERVTQLDDYLRQVTPGHPVFVWFHLFEPHEPYDPPVAFARGSSPRERYEGEVAAADAGVGGLVELFRRNRPGATVILTADHGEEFGEHGGSYHGTTLFDEQVRVPLVWSSPGSVAPRRIEAPVEILDVTTTLLAAMRIPRDARMRGDDLTRVLSGGARDPALRAFSSIDGERMWTDGRAKLICGEDGCQLFDLIADPRERRNVAGERPGEAAQLGAEMEALLASLPKVEALAMSGGGAWPDALAQARLGDRAVAPALVRLLGDGRAHIRAAAARALCDLAPDGRARSALALVRSYDLDPAARAEAAIASLVLGDLDARAQVTALLEPSLLSPPEVRRRAALALAAHGDGAGRRILLASALGATYGEVERVAAVRALGVVGDAESAQGLLALLSDVRLRTYVADALGALGGAAAIRALAAALEQERYPACRLAEARALLALGQRELATTAIRRFLGTESSLPDGVALLAKAGALSPPSGGGAVLREARHLLQGPWACTSHGCQPNGAASLLLPESGAPRTAGRLWLRVHAKDAGAWIRVAGREQNLSPGTSEVGFALACEAGCKVAIDAHGGVSLHAFAAVSSQPDVPAPAPEPW